MSIDDSLGGKSKQVIWNEAGWGTLGLLTRSERICGVAQSLLGGEVLVVLECEKHQHFERPSSPLYSAW